MSHTPVNQAAPHSAALERYSDASQRAADQIIRAYSTSFGAATRLLGPRHRQHVRNIYALVRVADELVDGVAAEAQVSPDRQLQLLDALEAETNDAVASGYSSNAIVHAYAQTARLSGIDASLTSPFFSSMRMDLRTLPALTDATEGSDATTRAHTPDADASRPETHATQRVVRFDAATHADYVYGSAEVVGLMCLRVFMRDESRTQSESVALEQGAKSLGAAFQNVNFLRDLADDTERLARSYLSEDAAISESWKAKWISTIRAELAEAEVVLPLLPADARTAVDCARRLFAKLTNKLDATPVADLLERRVRVSNAAKAVLIAQSLISQRQKG